MYKVIKNLKRAFVFVLMTAIAMLSPAFLNGLSSNNENVKNTETADAFYNQEYDLNESQAYRLQKCNSFNVGDIIIFSPNDYGEDTIVFNMPQGSGKLRVTAIGGENMYAQDYGYNINYSVEVLVSGDGFDYCSTGDITNNYTRYFCDWGGAQDVSGICYKYCPLEFRTYATTQIYVDNVLRDDVTVKAGNTLLQSTGNGWYTGIVKAGEYELSCDGVGYVTVPLDAYYDDGDILSHVKNENGYWIYQSQGTCEMKYVLHRYNLSVDLNYDENPYLNQKVELRDENGNVLEKMTDSDGDGIYTKTVDRLEGFPQTYYIYVNGKNTNRTLNICASSFGDTHNMKLTETLDYNTFTLNIFTDDEPITDAKVSIYHELGVIDKYLPYTGVTTQEGEEYKTTYTVNTLITGKEDVPYYILVNNNEIRRQFSLFADAENRVREIHYFTGKVTLSIGDEPLAQTNVLLTSAHASYNLLTDANGECSAKLNGDEVYSIFVRGVIDNNQDQILNLEDKTAEIQFYKVEKLNYSKSGDSYISSSAGFVVVREGNTVSEFAEGAMKGFAFNCWSEAEWTEDEDENDVTAFDFSTPINSNVQVYAHYIKTSVKINGYVRTNEDGTINGKGVCFRLENFSLAGFEEGDDSVNSIMLSVSGMNKIRFLSFVAGDATVSVKQGEGEDLSEDNEATIPKVIVAFSKKVSMAVAQQYVRENIAFMPALSTEITVEILVSDGIISASSSNTFEQNITSDAWIKIEDADYRDSKEFKNNYYVFTGNSTYLLNGRRAGGKRSGIKITGNVTFVIPAGVTVTAYGDNGSGTTPGSAGVYLPSSSSLKIYGAGTLSAWGGSAGGATSGGSGGGVRLFNSGNVLGAYGGYGGGGGNGGGGAGAGIGTNGGSGGTGGGGGGNGQLEATHADLYSNRNKNNTRKSNGGSGTRGNDGNAAASMGTLSKVESIKIDAHGGSGTGDAGNGSDNGGGQQSHEAYHDNKGKGLSKKYTISASGGQGGAGGKGGGGAYAIGTGGNGGAGGGGGAGGNSGIIVENGVNYGRAGSRGDYGTTKAGSSNRAGYVVTLSDWIYTVTFEGATENATTNYFFDVNGTAITVPDYAPAKGYAFFGWKIANYGKNVNGTAGVVTSASSTLYQPGDKFILDTFDYGNITFKPITMFVGGKYASDTITIGDDVFVGEESVEQEYYTYTIKLTLDGVSHNFGAIKIVDIYNGNSYKLSSSDGKGLYKIVLTEETEFDVYVNNSLLVENSNVSTEVPAPSAPSEDEIALFGPATSMLNTYSINTVNFKSIKVNISGINPENVYLTSDNGGAVPQLTLESVNDGVYTYSSYTQDVDDNDYQIHINEFTIPTSVKVANYDEPANIEFAYYSVNVLTNTTVNTVALKTDDSTVSLSFNGTKWEVSTFVDNDSTYQLWVNGINTGLTAKLDNSVNEITLPFYKLEVVTRLNGTVVTSIGDVYFGTTKAFANDNIYSAYILDDSELDVVILTKTVAKVTPTPSTALMYIDYYTVAYTIGDNNDVSGDTPTDETIYLSGTSVTLLDKNTLVHSNSTYYFAGWKLGETNYCVGEEITVENQLTFESVWSQDLVKVVYVDETHQIADVDDGGNYLGTYHAKTVETKSKLALSEKLRTIDAMADHTGRVYNYKNFIGWKCSIDGVTYDANTALNYTAQQIINNEDIAYDANNQKVVYFYAVYEAEYRYGIHFEGEVEGTDENGNLVLTQDDKDVTDIVIDYKVTYNDGINSIVLMPEFNDKVFAIKNIQVNGATVLGTETVTYDYTNASCPVKILLESKNFYNVVGDIFVSITYKMINPVGGKYTDFSFVTLYNERSDDAELDNDTRSHAYFWDKANDKEQTEVRIFVDTSKINVYIQLEGQITIDDQEIEYDSQSLTIGEEYFVATSFDEETTYYVYENGVFVVAEDVTADNFSEKTYFTLNNLTDVIFKFNGTGVNPECTVVSSFDIRWYTLEDETYTEIDAPKNVGVYYVGVSATKNDYFTATAEVKAKITITPKIVVIDIDDASSYYGEELATPTYNTTTGEVYEGDSIGLSVSVTGVTSTSLVGTYTNAITGTWNNNPNYSVTINAGDYEILIVDNTFDINLVTVDRYYNKVAIAVGSEESNADYFAKAKYGTVTYKFYSFADEVYSEIPAPTNAGTYYVKAFVAGDETRYNALESDFVKIVIMKVLVTIDELTASSKVYNATAQTWVVGDISGVPADALYTLSGVVGIDGEDYKNVGNPTIKVVATLNDADNYAFTDDVDYKNVVAEITRYAIIITPNEQSNQYTTENQTPGNNYTISVAEGDLPDFVSGDSTLFIEVVKKTVEDWIVVGDYTTAINYTTENYDVTTNEGVYHIIKAHVYVPTFVNYVYDKTEKTQTVEDDALYTISVTPATDAGTYTVTATLKDAENYTWVNVRTLTESFSASKEYYISNGSDYLKAYKLGAFAENQGYYYITEELDYVEATAYEQGVTYYEVDGGEYVEASVADANAFANGTYYKYENVSGYTAVEGSDFETFDGSSVTVNWVISPASVTVTIDDKTSVYGASLVDLTASVTGGEVYGTDNLGVTLSTTATSTSNAGEYPITGTWTNGNYDITFVDGTYTITIKKLNENEEDAKEKVVEAIKAFYKEYTGEELSWETTDFTISEIENQIAGDTVFGITTTNKIAGQNYLNANGTYVSEVWTYYTDDNGNIVKKYELVVDITNANYTFYGDVTTLTVEVEVFIYKATNIWTTSPSVQAETYSNIVKDSVAKFGDNAETKNFVTYYTEEACENEVTTLEAGKTYYAKFYVAGTDDYTSLTEVVSFELGYNKKGEPTIYLNKTGLTEKSKEIIYNGLFNYFAKNEDGTEFYNANGDTDAYTFTITSENANDWKDVGVYTLTFALKDNWAWNDGTFENIVYTLTIKKANLKITADNKSISYLDAVPTYTVTTSDDDFVNNETFATYSVTITDYISCTYAVGSPKGKYTITLADDANKTLENALYNYKLTLANGELTVGKKDIGTNEEDPSQFGINVTMEDLEVTYDTQSHSISINDVDGVSATYTIDGVSGNSATDVKLSSGEVTYYTIVATLTLSGNDSYGNPYADNYSLNKETVSAKLTIKQFEITITADDKTSVYGSDIKELTHTDSANFYASDNIEINLATYSAGKSVTLTSTSNVGEYTITPSCSGTRLFNYKVKCNSGKYLITRSLTNEWIVELETTDREYNAVAIAKGTKDSRADYFAEARLGDDTTVYTFYTFDNTTYTKLDSAPMAVGTYYVKADVAETDNYVGLTSGYVKIVISRKKIGVDEDPESPIHDMNVTMDDVVVTYDAQSHTVEISTVGGVSATYTIDGEVGNSAIDVKRDGSGLPTTYTIVATLTLTGNDAEGNSYADNYELDKATLTATLQINPLAVTVTPEDKETTYGTAATLTNTQDPEFYSRDNVVVSYVLYNEDGDEVAHSATLAVGEYTIEVDATNLNNYTVTFEEGRYIVTKAEKKDDDHDDTPDDAEDNDDPGLKITIKANDVYYNRSLDYTHLVKVGTAVLAEGTDYEIKFYDKDNQEVTPENAGTYTVKVIVAGTTNYDGAEKTATFNILKIALKATTFTYNKDTATFSVVTEDVGATNVPAKALKSGTTLTYMVGELDCTTDMSYKATAKGTYTVKVTADNENYLASEATTVEVFEVVFTDNSANHERNIANALLNENEEKLSAYVNQYRFSGQTADKPDDPTLTGYTFKQWNATAYSFETAVTADVELIAIWDINTYTVYWYNQATEIYHETYNYKDTPVYKVATYKTPTKTADAEYTYTFAGWNTVSDTLETITLPNVTEDATYYAIFSREGNPYTITYYISKDGGEYELYKVVQNVKFGTTIAFEELGNKSWFKTESWFTDQKREIDAPETMVAEDLTVYGAYVFDIGNGDVNADGIVNVDDITLYRQWIVGNYEMTTLENGTEWEEVNKEGFTTNTHYFLKRVADVNNIVENSNRFDIRDVSTIRMALVGGFNWGVATQYHVTGQEVTKSIRVSTKKEFMEAIGDVAIVTLTEDLELTRIVEITKDTTIYLNGHTILVDEDFEYDKIFNVVSGKLTIVGGTIDATAKTQIEGKENENEINPVVVGNGATVVLKDTTIKIDSITGACVYAFENGTAIIESGNYINLATEDYPYADGVKAMTLNQADVASQRIFVSGGTFTGRSPAEGDDSGLVTTFMNAGYSVTEVEDGVYKVNSAPNFLTFTANEDDSSVSVRFMSGSYNYSTSTDGGETWSIWNLGNNSALTTINLENAGDKVRFRGIDCVTDEESENFSMTGSISASGDVTSLTNGVGGDVALTKSYCYSYMFFYCTSLTTAPNLPSTTLSSYCYYNMFSHCSNLVSAPELPAKTLTSCCYCSTFAYCTSLVTAPELPATTLASNCYNCLFIGCTKLENAPELPAETLVTKCYHNMFNGCTSLTVAPEIKATSMGASYACYDMFKNCSALKVTTTNPGENGGKIFECTTIANSCVREMFKNTAGEFTADPSVGNTYYWYSNVPATLTTAPTATNLTYTGSALSLVTEGSATGGTVNYVLGTDDTTAPTTGYTTIIPTATKAGIYYVWYKVVGDANHTDTTPTCLTVKIVNYLTFTANADNSSVTPAFKSGSYEYSTTDGASWTAGSITGTLINLAKGEKVLLRGTDCVSNGKFNFAMEGSISASGDVTSLTNGIGGDVALASSCYYSLFKECSALTTAPNLPSTTLAYTCYGNMFYGCSALTTAPELPAETLASSCYINMFNGCSALVSAPTLSATILANGCYNCMFQGCTSLVNAPTLSVETLEPMCYKNMFLGCSKLETAPALPAKNLKNYCYACMFQDCTSLTTAPELPATTLLPYCYQSMFSGCSALKVTTTDPGENGGKIFTCTSVDDNCVIDMFGKTTGTFIDSNPAVGDTYYWYVEAQAEPNYLTFTANEDDSSVIAKFLSGSYNYSTSTDGGETWSAWTLGNNAGSTIKLNEGDKVRFKGKDCKTYYTHHFEMFGNISASGDVTSLTNEIGGDVELSDTCYANMFEDCESLTTAPNLPSTTLAYQCYFMMFSACSNLTTAPAKLPATTLKEQCYFSMFSCCFSLTTAPEICATNYWVGDEEEEVASECCYEMFADCSSLYVTKDISKATNGGKIITFTVYSEDDYHTNIFECTCGGEFDYSIETGDTYYWYIPEE